MSKVFHVAVTGWNLFFLILRETASPAGKEVCSILQSIEKYFPE
jgi:hypothetical protein